MEQLNVCSLGIYKSMNLQRFIHRHTISSVIAKEPGLVTTHNVTLYRRFTTATATC